MSAAHATFGPDGVKSRFSTLVATGGSCRESVVRTNRFAVRPRIPCVFISVATTFSESSKPRWFNSAVMRGLPSQWRTSARMSVMAATNSCRRWSVTLGCRSSQA